MKLFFNLIIMLSVNDGNLMGGPGILLVSELVQRCWVGILKSGA